MIYIILIVNNDFRFETCNNVVMLFFFCQIMIIDYKLAYPSGTATAVLINGFHTPKGDKIAKYESTILNSFLFKLEMKLVVNVA